MSPYIETTVVTLITVVTLKNNDHNCTGMMRNDHIFATILPVLSSLRLSLLVTRPRFYWAQTMDERLYDSLQMFTHTVLFLSSSRLFLLTFFCSDVNSHQTYSKKYQKISTHKSRNLSRNVTQFTEKRHAIQTSYPTGI